LSKVAFSEQDPSGMRTIRSCLGVLACFFSIGSGTLIADAAEGVLNFKVQLIWGTNKEKSEFDASKHKELQDVDPKCVDKLKKMFKWEHYYQIQKADLAVAEGKSEKKKLSDKCIVEVKNSGKAKIDVHLWGEGKLVQTVRGHPAGTAVVLGGGDKNDTAWFVMLTPKEDGSSSK
jgi:hypothetical protein